MTKNRIINSNPNVQTPWGPAQYASQHSPDVVFYGTASHGGFHLTGEAAKTFRKRLPNFESYSGRPMWFEEDCEWTLVALVFPDLFTPEELKIAHQIATSGYSGVEDEYKILTAKN